ncbi:MAG: hypothetical protein KDA22_04815 [Phycisphaerales bacterium]|nr:hypothetical protein [Phycisphaerales bacterium]
MGRANSLVVAVLGMSMSASASNLIVNGDFEDPGLAGINSDYVHTPQGNTDEGTWWVNPWDPGAPWFGEQHSRGGAGAMSANGDDSSQAGQKRVWYQVVPVQTGNAYTFTAWALATAAGFSGYSLQFELDGEPIGPVISPSAAFLWEEFSTVVIPKGSTTEISVVNVSGITFPNDFMLDDLSLVLIEQPNDLNGDGVVDGADLGILLSAWGPCSGCPADLDGSGTVDGADLGLLLARWTPPG